uniref:Immunoglobulin V-set domain-containing protein n=1 Tax=Neolamprologus brichardi TaxID=32507 RepID=A0A3Q4H926_NEOBR
PSFVHHFLQSFLKIKIKTCLNEEHGAVSYHCACGRGNSCISEILEYQLLKDSLKIFNVKKTMISFKTKEHRYLFLSNGTFRINNLSRSDSDNYTLQAFDSDGRRSDQRILQLFIQGIFSVLLAN